MRSDWLSLKVRYMSTEYALMKMANSFLSHHILLSPETSIDWAYWGHCFCVPVLSPFELFFALDEVANSYGQPMMILVIGMSLKVLIVKQNVVEQDGYPIDFCSKAVDYFGRITLI